MIKKTELQKQALKELKRQKLIIFFDSMHDISFKVEKIRSVEFFNNIKKN